ncbi:MAG TPA: hypothetical protein VLJ88_06195 [Propionibacteriaceae bacterium]|nr:hypothetical protein [Propionibacteriaceae bacterium]
MTCCGDRRARLTQGLRAAQSAPGRVSPTGGRTTLRYRGPVPMVLRGTASGEIYQLTEADVAVEVDSRDAVALIRTAWFASS